MGLAGGAMEEPRKALEQAAERRVACEVLPRRGGWSRGQIVRVEPSGVVLNVPGLRLTCGEDLRCWFSLDGQPRSFEASVIRTGVPIPDRSQFGLLLGFIDGWRVGAEGSSTEHGLDLSILPPNGPGLSLVHGPGRLVEISVAGLSFTLPAGNVLVFVEGCATRLRLCLPGEPDQEVEARIHSVHPGETHMLYRVDFLGIRDVGAFRKGVHALQDDPPAPEE
jgi:hypothetical protein